MRENEIDLVFDWSVDALIFPRRGIQNRVIADITLQSARDTLDRFCADRFLQGFFGEEAFCKHFGIQDMGIVGKTSIIVGSFISANRSLR